MREAVENTSNGLAQIEHFDFIEDVAADGAGHFVKFVSRSIFELDGIARQRAGLLAAVAHENRDVTGAAAEAHQFEVIQSGRTCSFQSSNWPLSRSPLFRIRNRRVPPWPASVSR